MTLPQQLEPFTAEGNLMMTIALKHGKLPYTGDIGQCYILVMLNVKCVQPGYVNRMYEMMIMIMMMTVSEM